MSLREGGNVNAVLVAVLLGAAGPQPADPLHQAPPVDGPDLVQQNDRGSIEVPFGRIDVDVGGIGRLVAP